MLRRLENNGKPAFKRFDIRATARMIAVRIVDPDGIGMLVGQVLVAGKLRDLPRRRRHAEDCRQLGMMSRDEADLIVAARKQNPAIELVNAGEAKR